MCSGDTGDRSAWEYRVQAATEALVAALFSIGKHYDLLGVGLRYGESRRIDESSNCWISYPNGGVTVTLELMECAPDVARSKVFGYSVDGAGGKDAHRE